MDCFSIYIFDNSNNMTKSKGKGKDIMLGINNFLFEDKGKGNEAKEMQNKGVQSNENIKQSAINSALNSPIRPNEAKTSEEIQDMINDSGLCSCSLGYEPEHEKNGCNERRENIKQKLWLPADKAVSISRLRKLGVELLGNGLIIRGERYILIEDVKNMIDLIIYDGRGWNAYTYSKIRREFKRELKLLRGWKYSSKKKNL